MRTENPTSLLHFELGPLQSSPMCGHHSTGWAARHMHASLKVRTEFPTLILHSKLGIVVKPGRRLNLPCWPSCTSHVGADGGASRISYPVPPLENAVFGTVPAFPPRLQSAGRQAVWGTRGAPSTTQFMFISPRNCTDLCRSRIRGCCRFLVTSPCWSCCTPPVSLVGDANRKSHLVAPL